MKYKIYNESIPQENRKEINEKILFMLENDSFAQYGITATDVFNSYTGLGGLHGLEFKDYNSFHSYTKAKQEIENGQFYTPHVLSKFLIDCLQPNEHDIIADLTCGMGNFFNYLPNELNVYGNEFELSSYKVSKYLYPNANLTYGDIRNYNPEVSFDIVLGNPPFNLKWNVGNTEYLSQLYYCIKSYELLKPNGIMALIVPKSFLNDEFTDGGMIKEINNMFNFVCQFELPLDSFKNVGVKSFETKIMLFTKKSEHITEKPYNSAYVESPSLNENGSKFIYNTYIKPILEEKQQLKNKLMLESLAKGQEEKELQYKVNKLLFDIKRNPKINKYYAKAYEYYQRLYTQKMPEGMEYKEWQKIRITPNKVLRYLKDTLNKQHKKPERHITVLVKNRYGLQLKAYSTKENKLLKAYKGVKEMSFSDMIVNSEYPFENKKYKKLFKKKLNQYQKQTMSFSEMQYNNTIAGWLDNFTLYNKDKQQEIKLFDYQKEALNKTLQKDYCMLNMSMGLGKTIMGICTAKYYQEHKAIRNVFIVSSSISITMTWEDELKALGIKYINVRKLSDIQKIERDDFVLITFNMLSKYKKQLRKYVKMQNQKVLFICDESHKISNNSQRANSTITVFRKCRYKLLMTGTATKNNVLELQNQIISLGLNHSTNAVNTCEYIYKEDAKTKEIKQYPNEYYMKPFPANNKSIFKYSFSPSRNSIFGVEKNDQSIYNLDELRKVIEAFIYTKEFNEVAGDKYEFITHRIEQNENEKEVYGKIMSEFHELLPRYFRSTGNSRKDSMLKIIRQLQLLRKATSLCHRMKEYNGYEEPNKYEHIENIINNNDEKVIVGTLFIEAAEYYAFKLANKFKNRKVHLIQGSITFRKRQEIIKDFQSSENDIIVCTQSSLAESVNIPECDLVICEGLQWNLPEQNQFIFRTVRINSKNKTKIHLITYRNTIDQNVLSLLVNKQRINDLVKSLEYKEQSQVFSELGIDFNVFESIIKKEIDENGNVRLNLNQVVVS